MLQGSFLPEYQRRVRCVFFQGITLPFPRIAPVLLLFFIVLLPLASCATNGQGSRKELNVVASENFRPVKLVFSPDPA